MNKKVSTIFAMAALMGGVFSGSAYAETLPVNTLTAKDGKVTLPKEVVLMQGNLILGFEKDANGTTQVIVEDYKNMESLEKALNFKWIVTTVAQEQGEGAENRYVFQNVVTKDTLSFKTRDFSKLQLTDKDNNLYAKDGYYTFTFGKLTGANYPAYSESGSILYSEKAMVEDENVALTLTNGETDAATLTKVTTDPETSITTPEVFKLGELRLNAVSADVLNALFNQRGFNFAAKPALANVAITGNIFAEQTVWAFDVNEGTDGYTLTTESADGKTLYIPNGTYFFTNPVFKPGKSFADATVEDIDWLASTLIYLSSTESQEGTDSNRAEGAGFVLATQLGSDFKFTKNASGQQGDDKWIQNACFKVQDNFANNDNYPYSLTVEHFWYQPKANAAGTDKQKEAKVCLDVVSYDNSRQSLVSRVLGASEDPAPVFKLEASSVVDGKTLLHDTKKAAVYTIKFISGNGNLNSKYLTVGAKGNINNTNDEYEQTSATAFQWEAKGAAIYDETFPIFQYTITAVSNDTEVTFTNRETGKYFTAQLFPADGTNRYYMAIKNYNLGATSDEEVESTDPNFAFKVQPYTVESKTNTYAVTPTNSEGVKVDAVTFAANYVVELKSIEEVNEYAGFVKEDEAVSRAIAFARDVHDTSNKMYVYVEDDAIANDFTNDLYASAQWQLKKVGEKEISRVYVYNNTTTKSVDDVPEGDKVKAYVYTLQYVEDGELVPNKYLAINNNIPELGSKTSFIIKENVDGSVSLINVADNGVFASRKVADYKQKKAVEVLLNGDEYEFDSNDYVYVSTSAAREIKTYLEEQPVDISWPAHEGHVTIESELGNYINMNENRDAIVVDETDADTYYLYVTDTEKKNVVPSFYITKGIAAENGERMFMFNPTDSVDYYVADGKFDKKYQWAENTTKVIFKAAKINDTRDTLTIDVKGETKYIAKKANDDNKDIWGGINRFKFQIIEATDAEGYYYIRQAGSDNKYATQTDEGAKVVAANYLSAQNDKVTWSDKQHALLFTVEGAAAPTANESVSATEVKIIATDGAVNVKNAAGKNVVISTILGQIVANEVLTSDNATISVPAGIAIVSVDGEEAVKVSVK